VTDPLSASTRGVGGHVAKHVTSPGGLAYPIANSTVTVVSGPVVTTSQHASERWRLPKISVAQLLFDATAFAADCASAK